MSDDGHDWYFVEDGDEDWKLWGCSKCGAKLWGKTPPSSKVRIGVYYTEEKISCSEFAVMVVHEK